MRHLFRSGRPGLAEWACLAAVLVVWSAVLALILTPPMPHP